MLKLPGRYRLIPGNVYRLIALEFCVQLMNASFMLILNLFLRNKGYDDPQIASLTAWRYLAVLLFSLPLGIFIRRRRLKPFLLLTAILVPLSSFLLLECVNRGWTELAKPAFFLWGLGLMFMQVCALPFILRNGNAESETEAISLNYATFSMGQVFAGILIYALSATGGFSWGTWAFSWDEYHLLMLLAGLSCCALIFAASLREKPPALRQDTQSTAWYDYDWMLIFRTLIPTTLLAIGAGLTIPFLNLFFNRVFGMQAGEYAVLGLISAGIVMVAALAVPWVRRAFGYKVAITLSQTLAVVSLFLLASTEQFREVPGMVWVACGLLLLRNPLMNMAGPMANELVMSYVGPRNQELVTALTHSIWSGAWVVSAKAFEWLREADLPYFQIFYITGGLYMVGVFSYYLLIRSYEKRKAGA